MVLVKNVTTNNEWSIPISTTLHYIFQSNWWRGPNTVA
jgi:hypothetical protein